MHAFQSALCETTDTSKYCTQDVPLRNKRHVIFYFGTLKSAQIPENEKLCHDLTHSFYARNGGGVGVNLEVGG